MASLLRNTEILSKLPIDVRANELFYHSKCLKIFQYHYETFLNKSKKNNTDTAFKNVVALEKQKALEIYSSYLTSENLPQESNIMRFGEMVLCHTKEFEIHKNNRNINVFILKAHYVKKTPSDQPFDCSMDFF